MPREVYYDLDIVYAHYGNCKPNGHLYTKTLFYYEAVRDPDDVCHTEEYQAQIDPENPLGFHPDQAVRPFFGEHPIYMQDNPVIFHRIRTTIDEDGKARISSRSDTPLDVEITIGAPHDCGRDICHYDSPVIDIDLKRRANEYSIIKALDYYTSTMELCTIHPNVFVMVNENIYMNPQFPPEVMDRIQVIYSNARHLIAVSQSVRSTLLMHGVPPSQISVINFWGCRTDFWHPMMQTRQGWADLIYKLLGVIPPRIITYVGRLHAHKGIHYLIDSLRSIPDAHLCIAGEGEIGEFLLDLDDELRQRVHYLGSMDMEGLRLLYNMSDVVILPSIPTSTWIEQFGRVLTEAMACGTPTVSTCVGGPLDIVEHGVTGYLVPPANSSALSETINNMLASPQLLSDMSVAGRERVCRLFSDAVSDELMQKCYRDNIWK